MMKRTHVAVGLAVTLPLIVNDPISALGVIGSVAPDFDIALGLKHRTVTHSFLAAAATTLLISPVNIKIAIVWSINYLLHLLLDGATKTGVPLLYPKKKYYGIMRFKTRDSIDYFIQLMAIAFICLVYLA